MQFTELLSMRSRPEPQQIASYVSYLVSTSWHIHFTGVFCLILLPGYHLVFVSNEVASCLPCERGRYNPVASSDSSGACRPCERGDARPVIGRTWAHGPCCRTCSLAWAFDVSLCPNILNELWLVTT